MKKFLIAIAITCGFGCSSLLAHEDEQPRRERGENNERADRKHRHRHHRHHHPRRGFAFSYYGPADVCGGIGSYSLGVGARVGNGVVDIFAAPFTTVPVLPPPRTYIYYPPRIRCSPPVIERIYPRRRYWRW